MAVEGSVVEGGTVGAAGERVDLHDGCGLFLDEEFDGRVVTNAGDPEEEAGVIGTGLVVDGNHVWELGEDVDCGGDLFDILQDEGLRRGPHARA